MQSFSTENGAKYSQMVESCVSMIEQRWNDLAFRAEFQNEFLPSAVSSLRSLIDGNQFSESNCVLVLSGKSANVSASLLQNVADRSKYRPLQLLVKSMVKLSDQDNQSMYSGIIPDSLKKVVSQGKTLVFIDEHSQDYAKAVSYLSTSDRNKIKSKFFVFAGRTIRSNYTLAEFMPRIQKATAKDGMVDFLQALGRLESERVRARTQFTPEILNRLGRQVLEKLELSSRLLTAVHRE